MTTLTIRNLDEHTKAQLRIQAALEARPPVAGGQGLGTRIHAHFALLGGVELELTEPSSSPTL